MMENADRFGGGPLLDHRQHAPEALSFPRHPGQLRHAGPTGPVAGDLLRVSEGTAAFPPEIRGSFARRT